MSKKANREITETSSTTAIIDLHGKAQEHAQKAVEHAHEAVRLGGECGKRLVEIKERVGSKNWALWKEGNLEGDLLEWAVRYERIVQQDLFNLEDPRQIRSAQNLLGIIPQSPHKAREERDRGKSWEASLTAWANKFGDIVKGELTQEQKQKIKFSTMEAYKWLKREIFGEA